MFRARHCMYRLDKKQGMGPNPKITRRRQLPYPDNIPDGPSPKLGESLTGCGRCLFCQKRRRGCFFVPIVWSYTAIASSAKNPTHSLPFLLFCSFSSFILPTLFGISNRSSRLPLLFPIIHPPVQKAVYAIYIPSPISKVEKAKKLHP